MESKEMELGESPREWKFGQFEGRYVPEILLPALKDLEEAYEKIKSDVAFQRELRQYREDYCGRPSPLYWAKNLTAQAGGAKIYLKREDLCYLGVDFNSILGQALLAKKAGKKRIIVTGVRSAIATAAAGAILCLETKVYLRAKEQRADLFKITSAGAKVQVTAEDSLSEAINIAFQDFAANFQDTYLVGSSLGPHPYPTIVRDFQRIIGDEIKGQLLRKEHRLPDLLAAYVGIGSGEEDATIGAFSAFVEEGVALLGVQAAEAAPLVNGSIGVLYGAKTYLLQDESGEIICAGPEHAFYKDIGRAKYVPVTAEEAQEGLCILAETEGIIASPGAAHAVYAALQCAKELGKDAIVVILLSSTSVP